METATAPNRPKSALGRRIGLWLGPVLFLAILLFADLQPGRPLVTRMAAVAALMAVWWISEAIPLAATSLLPLILFPLLGIMGGRQTAPIYINHVIFLFVGGFMIALAMEQWGLHKRIALWIIRLIGGHDAGDRAGDHRRAGADAGREGDAPPERRPAAGDRLRG
jgi:sodium-dependent dicarboxylate transporter 2/3/5